MNIQISDQPLRWGELDVGLFGLANDWYGELLDKPLTFSLAVDHDHLWFIACHESPAMIHPAARPGEFQPELWKHDVAEFFLLDTTTGRYLEFNLAPNGAWWSAFFTAPRVRENTEDKQLEGVATYADLSTNGSWMTAAALPLKMLRQELNFGDKSMMNVTFIVNSPKQQFVSATKLHSEEPDYHRPNEFKKITFFH